MKKILLSASLLVASLGLFAQSNSIPNPSFENWTYTAYQDPINCQTANDQNGQSASPITVLRVTDAFHGKYAVELKSVKFGADTEASYFALGNPGGGGGPTGGSPISGAPTGFRLYYKYTIKTHDTAIIIIELKQAGVITNQFFYQIYDTTSVYKFFTQSFAGITQTPDSIIIAAASSSRVINSSGGGSNGWAPGSIFEVDSMTFTGLVSQPKDFDGDFENWNNDTIFNLTGWNVNENGDSLPIRTNDAYAGKYAVELATSYSNCNSCSSNIQATEITTGKPSQNSGPKGGLPYTLQKDTLEFFYKFSSPKNFGDSAYVGLQFHNSSNTQNYDIYLDTASHYRKVDFPFDMTTLFTPDSVMITMYSSITRKSNGGLPATDLGAVLKVDSMHFKSQLSISTVPANPAFCSGSGGVKITASGATSYTWSPSTGLSATTGSSVTANPFGSQTYTITGTSGALVGTQTVVVTENFPPTVTITPPSASICSGSQIGLTASGTSVSYTWSPSASLSASTGTTVSAAPATTTPYTVTGTSAAGCKGTNVVNVIVTTTPTVSVLPTSAVICSGAGPVTVKASGATNYAWKPTAGLSASTGATVQANPTVTTTYTLVGSNGSCTDTITIKVRVDSPIKPNLTSTNVSCNGDCNGTAFCGTNGGTSPYVYSWSPGGQTSSVVLNLCQGSYTVNITDSLGCIVTTSITITQPQTLVANATGIPTTCGQSNGQGITNPTGGTTPYSYSWNSNPIQTTQNATGLAAGKYTVVITDANKCVDTAKITIAASSAPAITVKITPSNCGTHNGIATASVTNGTTPYKYAWNNGATTSTVDSLAAGVYIVTVTDKNGCSSFEAVTVSDTNGPSLSVTSVTQNKCHGQSIGAITVTASGGKTPYHYFWSNGATTTTISGLPAGPYQVTVTDGTGCSDVKTINITAPAAIALTPSSTQANCKVADGGASILVTGGTSPYIYSWNTAATTSAVSNVAAGTYTVIITDNNGCKDSADVSVSNASGPVVKIISVVSDSCTAKGSSGSISISDSAGSSPYTYAWSNGATTSNIIGLAAGSYAVTVTDAAGCIGTINGTVKQVQPPAISICMVTVNPANNQNQVIWNKSFTQRIAKYNVYKETTQPGVFGLIGSVKSDSTCIFDDTLSNAAVRSWRYEISQVDSCGNESPLSLPHKTMHLTINQGTGSTINLIWDNYQGLSFGYYIVYRDTMPGVAIDSLNYVTNSGIYTFSDNPLYSATHAWYYHMGISNPGGCTPAIEAINYNASKSNTGNVTVLSGIAQVDAEASSLEIFPNPSTGMVNMSIFLASEKQNITVKVINTMGQVLWSNKYDDVAGNLKKQIDMSLYSKGLYIIQVTTNNSSMFRKVVIQ